MEISHLQYADDTICIGKPTVDNLWTLKAVSQGFEVASGLQINFLKSCLTGRAVLGAIAYAVAVGHSLYMHDTSLVFLIS